MKAVYQISFRTKLQNSLAIQRLHDCLKKLNVKYWTYDFQKLLLTLRSEFPDFQRIQHALRLEGYKCDFIKLENLEVATA
jgi:tRNA G26 N,N-dimethylase Trm1